MCKAKSQASSSIYYPQHNNTGLFEMRERNRAYVRHKLLKSAVSLCQRSSLASFFSIIAGNSTRASVNITPLR